MIFGKTSVEQRDAYDQRQAYLKTWRRKFAFSVVILTEGEHRGRAVWLRFYETRTYWASGWGSTWRVTEVRLPPYPPELHGLY